LRERRERAGGSSAAWRNTYLVRSSRPSTDLNSGGTGGGVYSKGWKVRIVVMRAHIWRGLPWIKNLMLGRGASGKKTGVIKKREWEGGCNKHQQHGVDGESLAKRRGSAGGFEATVGGEEERLI
jgi:hypothetical protein